MLSHFIYHTVTAYVYRGPFAEVVGMVLTSEPHCILPCISYLWCILFPAFSVTCCPPIFILSISNETLFKAMSLNNLFVTISDVWPIKLMMIK